MKTTTEPVLYYRPWELRAEEEELIKRQIEEAENGTQMEPNGGGHKQQDPASDDIDMTVETDQVTNDAIEEPKEVDTSLPTNGKLPPDVATDESGEDTKGVIRPEEERDTLAIRKQTSNDALKDHIDETGEDVVQGDEDAVLY